MMDWHILILVLSQGHILLLVLKSDWLLWFCNQWQFTFLLKNIKKNWLKDIKYKVLSKKTWTGLELSASASKFGTRSLTEKWWEIQVSKQRFQHRFYVFTQVQLKFYLIFSGKHDPNPDYFSTLNIHKNMSFK